MKLPYDPEIPFLGMQPKELKTGTQTCTRIFIEALFSIAKTWKQLICPSTNEWIKM